MLVEQVDAVGLQALEGAVVTRAYKLTLFALTGRVNNSAFKGFAAGECLFLGAAGTKRGSGDWEIGYRFASSTNVTGLIVGDITGINKKGWEYLSVPSSVCLASDVPPGSLFVQ